MRNLCLGLAVCILCGWLLSAATVSAEPVTLEEIARLRMERKSAAEIMETIEARGVGFELTPEAERQLRFSRFDRRMLARLRHLRENPPQEAAPEDAAQAEAPAARPALTPAREAEYQAFDERLDRIIANSNTGLVKGRTDHLTIVSEKDLIARFEADVKQLERRFREEFPAPLGTGTDPRKAVIVLTRTRYDYENFIEALLAQYAEAGVTFDVDNPREALLRTNNLLLDGMMVCCLEDAPVEAARHRVAYGVGYHYMQQLTGGRAPVALVAGFGNYAEAALMRVPTVVLTSGYNPRDVAAAGNAWANLVNREFVAGKVNSLLRIVNFDTSAMEQADYALCWSFVTLLAGDRQKFAKLVEQIRDGGDTLESIAELYQLDEPRLLTRWRQFAARQR